MTRHQPRPWYCLNSLTDDYHAIAESGGNLKMLRTLKILRSLVVNCGIIGVTLYSLINGADATFIGVIGILTLGLYNGVEVADYAALAQAFVEVKQGQSDDRGE